MKTKHGFTLIELLIVVAIIAILAAIAVPNFLEAQVRSKVSRVKADARSLATGIEAYVVDNNKLFRTYRLVGETREYLMSRMTTPIAYISSIPFDPFNLVDQPKGNQVITIWGPDYINQMSEATRVKLFSGLPEYSDGTKMLRRDFWMLFSLGPDKLFQCLDPVWGNPTYPYDPTNGTISKGDIHRFQS